MSKKRRIRNTIGRYFSRCFPLVYANWVIKRSDPDDNWMDDMLEWRRRLEDLALVKKANKVGIYLDEFPYPVNPHNPKKKSYSHWHQGNFEWMLIDESRVMLRKSVRDYEPIYLRNRRESMEFWLKWIPAVTVLMGTLSGVIDAFKK